MAPQDRIGLHYLNPDVPDVIRLPSPLRVGTEIAIIAKVPDGGERFHVQFQKGTDDRASDIALIFNPSFDGAPMVARNSCFNNIWGHHETDLPGQFPFHCEVDFRLDIKITKECYKTTLDGQPLFQYKHRCPIELPTHLRITGALQIASLSFFDPLSSSLVATLPSSYHVGDTYTISGHPTSADAEFHVNVQASDTDNDNVLLDVNPHLQIDTGKVILNSRINKKWDDDEQIPEDMPFSDGKKFVLVISVHKDRFEILVDGKKLADYKHKTDVKANANFLVINGGVSLFNVIIKSPRGTDPAITEPMIIDPIIKPNKPLTLPAIFTIPNGFKSGEAIRIKGKIPDWSKVGGFIIDLKEETTDLSAILMRMHVRIDDFPRNTVTRNVFIKERAAYKTEEQLANERKTWGTEESHLIGDFPFKKGNVFDIEMHQYSGTTYVKVNGNEVFTFIRRVFTNRFARYLYIRGIVEINYVGFPVMKPSS